MGGARGPHADRDEHAGLPRPCAAAIPFAIAAVVVNAVIDVALLSRIGVVAAAIGTDAGIAVFTIGALWICRRESGTD